MNQVKPLYLLSGGRGRNNNSFGLIVRQVFREIDKAVPSIGYVGAASDDNLAFFKHIAGMLKTAGAGKITLVRTVSAKADPRKIQDALKAVDAVFMSGGDTERGIKVLEEKKLIGFFRELYQQGKVFFGVSAGSILMAREWVGWSDPDDDSTAALFPCLGLAPVLCDTHAEEDGWEELKTALRLGEDNAKGYGISTGACLRVLPDGSEEAIGGIVQRYVRHGDKVERLNDLVPL